MNGLKNGNSIDPFFFTGYQYHIQVCKQVTCLSRKSVGGAPMLKGFGPSAALLADCFELNEISSTSFVVSSRDRFAFFRSLSRSALMRSNTSLFYDEGMV